MLRARTLLMASALVLMFSIDVSADGQFEGTSDNHEPVGSFAFGMRSAPSSPEDASCFQFPLNNGNASQWIRVGFNFGDNWTCSGCAGCGGYYKLHTGIDVAAYAGQPVQAAADGVIYGYILDSSWGYCALVEHDVPGEGAVFSQYWHVNHQNNTGQAVSRGQTFTTAYDLGGNTHLHFGIWYAGFVGSSTWAGALPNPASGCGSPFPQAWVDPTAFVEAHLCTGAAEHDLLWTGPEQLSGATTALAPDVAGGLVSGAEELASVYVKALPGNPIFAGTTTCSESDFTYYDLSGSTSQSPAVFWTPSGFRYAHRGNDGSLFVTVPGNGSWQAIPGAYTDLAIDADYSERRSEIVVVHIGGSGVGNVYLGVFHPTTLAQLSPWIEIAPAGSAIVSARVAVDDCGVDPIVYVTLVGPGGAMRVGSVNLTTRLAGPWIPIAGQTFRPVGITIFQGQILLAHFGNTSTGPIYLGFLPPDGSAVSWRTFGEAKSEPALGVCGSELVMAFRDMQDRVMRTKTATPFWTRPTGIGGGWTDHPPDFDFGISGGLSRCASAHIGTTGDPIFGGEFTCGNATMTWDDLEGVSTKSAAVFSTPSGFRYAHRNTARGLMVTAPGNGSWTLLPGAYTDLAIDAAYSSTRDAILVVHVGADGAGNIYYALFDPTTLVALSSWIEIAPPGSTALPAHVAVDDLTKKAYVTFVTPSGAIKLGTLNLGSLSFEGWSTVPGNTPRPVSVSTGLGKVWLAHFGNNGTGLAYYGFLPANPATITWNRFGPVDSEPTVVAAGAALFLGYADPSTSLAQMINPFSFGGVSKISSVGNSVRGAKGGASTLQLSWNAASGATSYEIHRSTVPWSLSPIATSTSTSYTDSTPGTFFYALRSLDYCGNPTKE